MAEVLTHIQELTPAWLEDRLGQNPHIGYNLGCSRVAAIEVANSHQSNTSFAYYLRVHYTEASHALACDLPHRLFLKIPKAGQVWGTKEIDFYNLLVPPMLEEFPGHLAPFVRYVDAAHSPSLNRSHLLLEDLSETHFTNAAKVPSTRALCEAIIDAFATLHAFWWEHPWLGHQVGEFLTDRAIDDMIRCTEDNLVDLLDVAGDDLNPNQRRALAAVASAWPAHRRARVIAGKGITVVHRDPHPLNFLYPHDPALDRVKLIDWESWRVDTGTDDLAYLMACHWSLAECPEVEMSMLMRYCRGMEAAGIDGYSWEDVLYDYRASVIRSLFFMIFAWSPPHRPGGIWWERVEQCLAAYTRLACHELLE